MGISLHQTTGWEAFTLLLRGAELRRRREKLVVNSGIRRPGFLSAGDGVGATGCWSDGVLDRSWCMNHGNTCGMVSLNGSSYMYCNHCNNDTNGVVTLNASP